jgi:hypothetical protein
LATNFVLTLERLSMHSHAGAWERGESSINNVGVPIVTPTLGQSH